MTNEAGSQYIFSQAPLYFPPALAHVFARMKTCVVLFLAVSSLVAASRAAETGVSFLENLVLRVRVNLLTEPFAEPTNPVSGAILDLRFADDAAPAAADYFARKKPPLVILVNSQTRGEAAVLAAQLRASSSAIVIGSTNPPGKITPDIAVAVSVDDERKFQDNPYAAPVTNRAGYLSATNNLFAFVDHTSEAELVRKRIKDGDEAEDLPTRRAEPLQPVIRDPALARALDLLKALAALHPARG
jgi:hypothetical protein